MQRHEKTQVGSSSTVCMNLKCIAAYLITGLQLRYRRNHFIMTMSMLEDTIEGVYEMLLPERMVVADLGCSSGRNTMLVVSEVLDISIMPSAPYKNTRGRLRRRRGICMYRTMLWECQAPSTEGFSHAGEHHVVCLIWLSQVTLCSGYLFFTPC
ncbi:hypothetical protein BHM03_00039742 [Ensete ventricosum]|nr:hypothetical protein BHM03_00039742 [Ensete ventricosum]